jgi:hemoglobin-like flavoprotein
LVPRSTAAANRLAETPSSAPDRLAALRTFFVEMEPRLPVIVALTYDKMFAAKPEIALLFKGSIHEQQLSFLAKLKSIVLLTRSSQLWPVGVSAGPILIPQIAAFGRSHVKIGVPPEDFALMKEMMTRACKETAPANFTQLVEEGLGFIFDVLAQSLTAGDGSARALSELRLCRNGAALYDPVAYFDGEAPAATA